MLKYIILIGMVLAFVNCKEQNKTSMIDNEYLWMKKNPRWQKDEYSNYFYSIVVYLRPDSTFFYFKQLFEVKSIADSLSIGVEEILTTGVGKWFAKRDTIIAKHVKPYDHPLRNSPSRVDTLIFNQNHEELIYTDSDVGRDTLVPMSKYKVHSVLMRRFKYIPKYTFPDSN